AAATAHATAPRTIRSYSCSRFTEGTSFEWQTPGMCRSGWSRTAAATTGPARQPRPTSSTPATCTNPTRRSEFSSVRVAGTRTIKNYKVKVPFTFCLLPSNFYLLTFSLPRPLLHPGGFALEVAQVIQLGTAHFGRPHHFDLLNRRRV